MELQVVQGQERLVVTDYNNTKSVFVVKLRDNLGFVGITHELNKEEIRELIKRLNCWLEIDSLDLEKLQFPKPGNRIQVSFRRRIANALGSGFDIVDDHSAEAGPGPTMIMLKSPRRWYRPWSWDRCIGVFDYDKHGVFIRSGNKLLLSMLVDAIPDVRVMLDFDPSDKFRPSDFDEHPQLLEAASKLNKKGHLTPDLLQ